MFEAAITIIKILTIPCSLAFVALLSLSPDDPTSCKEVDAMVDAHYVTLALKNGGHANTSVDAVFIELPMGDGLYSDDDTPCKLLTRVETVGGTKHYTNGQHSLDVYLGPDKDALEVVYNSETAHYWRATAPVQH